jgi:hypothetical protein
MAVNQGWLDRSIKGSYFSLRITLTILGFLIPVTLVSSGVMVGCDIQTSLSAYFHTPVRDLFVGLIFMLAAPLYLYKGFSERENNALNIAALGAVLVALFPTDFPGTAPCLIEAERAAVPTLHAIGAFALFLGAAFVAIFCAPETLHLLPPAKAARYRAAYRTLGAIMVLTPVTALAITMFAAVQPYFVLVVEILGMVTLASFWLIKTQEIHIILTEHPEVHLA